VKLSVVVPAWNEAQAIASALVKLQPLREKGHEIIVVDGSSRDDTAARASPWADLVLTSPRGRARQMNAGARAASGDALLFLHADSYLPEGADGFVAEALRRAQWGRFDVRLSGTHPLLRVVERMMNWRSRATGIATGDQAVFVHRELFDRVGGFPDIALMEDIALSTRLKRCGPPACLKARVIASSRRWEQRGIVRTIVLMWGLRLAFFLGADPRELARRYYGPGAE
jgi:rSAM/selenodomain-associated transferase 2